MASAMYGLSTGVALDSLKRMGLDAFEFDKFNSIPAGSIVIIYDNNGMIDLDILATLIQNACNIKYIYEEGGEVVEKYLVNQNMYDVYSGVSEKDLTSDMVMDIVETRKTKVEQQETTRVFSALNSISLCTQLLTEFITAVDNKDVDKLTILFEKDFDKILQFSELYADELKEKENMRRELVRLKEKVEESNLEVEKVKNLNENIVKSGQELQNDNKQLAESLIALKNMLTEKEEEILKLHESSAQSSLSYQALEKDLTTTKRELEQSTTDYKQLKLQQDKLIKQLDSLQEKLKQASFNTDALSVTLTNTYNVQKILYIKCLDQVPYLVYSMRQYYRYLKGKLGDCGMIFILPKNSFILKNYRDKFSQLTEGVKEVVNDSIYYMEDYSLAIEDYIKLTSNKNLVVVDLTLRDNVFLKSVRVKRVYVINNAKTIEYEGLNPVDCMSFNDLTDSGVLTRIPLIEKENIKNPGKVGTSLRMSFFQNADRWWV